MFILDFNEIVGSLNGVRLPSKNANLKNTRLEPYALAVLFYQLNKLYPVFSYPIALQLMEDNPSITALMEMVPQ